MNHYIILLELKLFLVQVVQFPFLLFLLVEYIFIPRKLPKDLLRNNRSVIYLG